MNDGDGSAYPETRKRSTERDDESAAVVGEGQGYGMDPAEPNYPALVYGPSNYGPPEIPLIPDYQTVPGADYYASPSTDHRQPNAHHNYGPPPGVPRYGPRPPPSTRYRQPPVKNAIVRYPVPSGSPPNIVVPASDKSAFDWETVVGVLALFKFALIKMKAFGLIQLLLFLLFTLKSLMGMVLFKSLVLLKVTKFLKLLLTPQLIVLLGLPVVTALLLPFLLATVFSIPARITDLLKNPENSTALQVPTLPFPMIPATLPAALPAATVPSTNPAVASLDTLARPVGGMESRGDLTNFLLMPGRLSTNTKFSGTLPSTKAVRPESLSPGPAVNDKRVTRYLSKNDSLNLPHDRSSNESSWPSNDPNIPDVVRDVLNTDGCVERIACRLAASEKAGFITPPRMNW